MQKSVDSFSNRNIRCFGMRLAKVLIVVPFTLITSNLLAQDSDVEPASTGVLQEEIVVTGSRIINSKLTSPIPMQSIGLDHIDNAGTVDVGELLEQIPGVYLGTSPNNSLLSTQNSGLSTVSLRNLGTNRTLTLIDGHRVVSNSGSLQAVDTGTIPSGFLDRIEITTGGSSAVYGSDAIAGVANIVFVKDFEGLKIDLRTEDSFEGGAERNTVDATWGFNYAEGRGNLMIGGFYGDRGGLFGRQRDYAASDLEVDIETGEFEINRSSFLPGGRFEGDAWNINGVWQNDQVGSVYCLDDGRVPACDDYQEALDGYDFRPLSQLVPERERSSIIARTSFDFTSELSGWALVQYTDITTRSTRAAANVQDASTWGPFDNETRIGDMAADHPFIHPAVQETLSGTVDWRRRFNEVGLRFREANRETLRTGFGLDGALSDDWSWSAYAGYGEYQGRQIRENEINKRNVDLALDIEADPDNVGGYRCIDAAARADGCVPLNVFGEGSITEEMADYVRATDRLSVDLEQTALSFTVNGTFMDLPAGRIETAMGVDYRKEQQTSVGDEDTAAGLTTTGFIPSITGDYDVVEAFVEFKVPLLKDQPFAKSVDFATALRIADYSTVGQVESWNFGLTWSPSEDIMFRAQRSQAQRAPDITELFSPQRSDFDDLNHPCDNIGLAATGVVADNCRSLAGVLEAINDPAGSGVFEQDGSSVFGPNSGNVNLQEETANTFTAGFVFTPRAVEGFSLIVDYFDIQVEDSISSVETQLAVDLCFNDASFSNKFCDSISFDPDGQIGRVINQDENLNQLTVEGVDVTANYDFTLSSLRLPGEFDASLVYTHVLTNEEEFNGPTGAIIDDFKGEVGEPIDEYRMSLNWKPLDGLSVGYRLNYTGTAINDNAPVPTDVLGSQKFERTLIHNLRASYRFGGDDQYRLSFGINNITDDNGPYLPDGYKDGENSNVGDSYDRVGRRAYLGFRYSL